MKKRISLFILTVMLVAVCFSVLSACSKIDAYYLEIMRDELRDNTAIAGVTKSQLYVTNASFTVPSTVKCLDESDNVHTANLLWTVVGGNGKISISDKATDGKYTVNVPTQEDGDITYVLVATLVDTKRNQPFEDANGKPYTVEFSCKVAAKGTAGDNTGGNTADTGNQGGTTTKTPLEQLKEASISNPVAGTSYLMAMYQGSVSKTLYVTGELATSGTETFLATTEDKNNAATITVETASGGFYICFTAKGSSVPKYLGLVDKSGTNPKTNVTLVDSASNAAVYTVGDSNILVSNFNGNKFFLSTHGSYETIGSSSEFYMTDSSKNNAIDVSQWVARLIPADVTIGGRFDRR